MTDDEYPTAADRPPTADIEDTTLAARLGPGTDVHGYIIDGELGRGGMGYVYSATHPLIGKRAAIKVLKPEVSRSPVIVERFIQEARAVNQIRHPNIIDIFAFGTLPDGRAYHVMDLLVGETLRKRVKRGPLHPSEAASIIDDTASALIAAHECGFVHRDLKPDNVFLCERQGAWPDVRLLDFGLAKLMPEAGIAPFTTKTGVMLGTPEYMSPEQARGVGVDHRTDIYALGILTFEVLVGQRPFPSLGDAFAMLQAHAEEPPPSLRDMIPDLPGELSQLVDAMLAKEPAARPSLAAVRTVLKRLRSSQLPSRTAAGAELASYHGGSRSPIPLPESSLAASLLGAAPMMPSVDRKAGLSPGAQQRDGAVEVAQPARNSQLLTDQLRKLPLQSSAPLEPDPITPSSPSQQPPSAYGSNPDPRSSEAGVVRGHGSNPGMPAKSTHGRGTGASVNKEVVTTALGVAPPPRSKPRTNLVALGPPPKQSNHLWLVIGALVAIAAGIAIALVLVGN